jgi:hypothetical protein
MTGVVMADVLMTGVVMTDVVVTVVFDLQRISYMPH